MPRIRYSTKKMVGIASRVGYERRLPTPYWRPIEEDDEDEEAKAEQGKKGKNSKNTKNNKHHKINNKEDCFQEDEEEEEEAEYHDGDDVGTDATFSRAEKLRQQQQQQAVASIADIQAKMARLKNKKRKKKKTAAAVAVPSTTKLSRALEDDDDEWSPFRMTKMSSSTTSRTGLSSVRNNSSRSSSSSKKKVVQERSSTTTTTPAARRHHQHRGAGHRNEEPDEDEEEDTRTTPTNTTSPGAKLVTLHPQQTDYYQQQQDDEEKGEHQEDEEEKMEDEHCNDRVTITKQKSNQSSPSGGALTETSPKSPSREIDNSKNVKSDMVRQPKRTPEMAKTTTPLPIRDMQKDEVEECHDEPHYQEEVEDDIMEEADDEEGEEEEGKKQPVKKASPQNMASQGSTLKLQIIPAPEQKIRNESSPKSPPQFGMRPPSSSSSSLLFFSSPPNQKLDHATPLIVQPLNTTSSSSTRPSPRMTQVVVVTTTASPRNGPSLQEIMTPTTTTTAKRHQESTPESAPRANTANTTRTTTTTTPSTTALSRSPRNQDVSSLQSPSQVRLLEVTSSSEPEDKAEAREQQQQQQQQQQQELRHQQQHVQALQQQARKQRLREQARQPQQQQQAPQVELVLDETLPSPCAGRTEDSQVAISALLDLEAGTPERPPATPALKDDIHNHNRLLPVTHPVAATTLAKSLSNNDSVDDGCCTCCNCRRQRLGQNKASAQGDNRDDKDDGNTSPRELPNFYKMMELWRHCEARLSELAIQLQRVTQVVFPLDRNVTPFRPHQPSPQGSSGRRRRRRVYIDDSDDDSDGGGGYEEQARVFDEYSDRYSRRQRPQTWPGHDDVRYQPVSYQRPVASSLSAPPRVGSLAEDSYTGRFYTHQRQMLNHRRARTPPTPIQTVYHDDIHDDGVVMMHASEPVEQRKLPARNQAQVFRFEMPSPRRSELQHRVVATNRVFCHNEMEEEDQQRILYDTQPYPVNHTNSHNPVQARRSPRNEKLLPRELNNSSWRQSDQGERLSRTSDPRDTEQEFSPGRYNDEVRPIAKKPRLTKEHTMQRPIPPDNDNADEDVWFQQTSIQLPGERATRTGLDKGDKPPSFQSQTGSRRTLGWNHALRSLEELDENGDIIMLGAVKGQLHVNPDSKVNESRQFLGPRESSQVSFGNDHSSKDIQEEVAHGEGAARDTRLVQTPPIELAPPAPLRSQQSDKLATLEQRQDDRTNAPVTLMTNRGEDDERIRLLDDFLGEQDDNDGEEEDEEEIEVLKDVGNSESERRDTDDKELERHADHEKVVQGSLQVGLDNDELELRRTLAAFEEEMREKRDLLVQQHEEKYRQNRRRLYTSCSHGVAIADKIKSNQNGLTKETCKSVPRGKQLVLVQTSKNRQSSESVRSGTASSRNLRGVVPSFDSLAAAGDSKSFLSRKRGRVEH